MENKIKVLFIATDFYQAGTERFMYEVDKAIDRNKFDISILSFFSLNASKRWKDHYYELHKQLGSKIFFYEDFKPVTPTLKKRIVNRLKSVVIEGIYDALAAFFRTFDVISIWGEYNYGTFKKAIDQETEKKCLIHIMNTKYQSEILYQHFDKNKTFHFVSGFYDKELAFELSEFTKYRHTFFPLSIGLNNAQPAWQFDNSPKKKIGIFTRLSRHKALDPFIYSFHLLLQQIPDAELHIFGSGDPEKEGMADYVRHLHLNDKVKFRGHAENLKETALNEKLNLVWFHAYHGIPGGFAGFDICTTGIPQLFWNFGTASDSDMHHIFPMYHNLLSFVAKNTEILSCQNKAVELSERQFHYVVNERNIQKHIGKLEELYLNIAKNKENL